MTEAGQPAQPLARPQPQAPVDPCMTVGTRIIAVPGGDFADKVGRRSLALAYVSGVGSRADRLGAFR
jgi:hypothetical protein